jgi:2-amino-4-hydroxy-6-hydroxymethyldihydropteridine diphosphokinase
LDILLLGDLRVSEQIGKAGLEIPHPRLAERAFVLIPLAEIAPQALVAPSGETVAELLGRLQNSAGKAPAVFQIQSKVWRSDPGFAR